MQSIREIYKIGRGPSSSHTMGPEKAAKFFLEKYKTADSYKVILYGSLAKTGKGHHTDLAINSVLGENRTSIVFDTETPDCDLPHENTMDFFAYSEGKEIGRMRALSIGGGDISVEGTAAVTPPEVYTENSFAEISAYCKKYNLRLSDYVYKNEGDDIKEYLSRVWSTMKAAIAEGLSARGVLEGGLGVQRKAAVLFGQHPKNETDANRENRIVCAYAFAVGEQNAAGGTVVTAPTCGACSVLPAALKYMQETCDFPDDQIINALAVGGIVGNIVKTNASISGAECGCQAEMGTACSMTAAALCELFKMKLSQTEYAAEVAMEHQLGLTCDPICGLVQIPCIERGAVSSMRAINALSLATFLASSSKISFDNVVKTMYRTGKDMNARYRETSEGGLAYTYKKP